MENALDTKKESFFKKGFAKKELLLKGGKHTENRNYLQLRPSQVERISSPFRISADDVVDFLHAMDFIDDSCSPLLPIYKYDRDIELGL